MQNLANDRAASSSGKQQSHPLRQACAGLRLSMGRGTFSLQNRIAKSGCAAGRWRQFAI
jgi:hypothetical protein